MIFGQGAITAYLLNEDGSLYLTLSLERPMEREIEDFEDVELDLGTDVAGQKVSEYQGVRFHAHYRWLSHGDNQDNMAVVQRLANWRGNGRRVRLRPHDDQVTFLILCEVTSNPIRLVGGKISAEEIEVELWGVDTLPAKPNPAYDVIYRAFGRAYLTA